VAKARLHEMSGELRSATKARAVDGRGRMTIGDCSGIFPDRLRQGFGLRGRGKMGRKIRPDFIPAYNVAAESGRDFRQMLYRLRTAARAVRRRLGSVMSAALCMASAGRVRARVWARLARPA